MEPRQNVKEAIVQRFDGERPGAAVAPASPPDEPVLETAERLLVTVVFALWLVTFAGGMLVDTRPYRLAISTGGVYALEGVEMEREKEAAAAQAKEWADTEAKYREQYGLGSSWLVVLVWYLPINLALLCALSGMLGAFGNRANLQHDGAERPRDNSNPYVSALLRGFFVYLIMISGVLLLDDDPFSSPSPSQYFRLAGFLCLFSFVVNYHPQAFGKLLMRAVNRIDERSGAEKEDVQVQREVHFARKTVEVGTVQTTTNTAPDDDATPAPSVRPAPVLNGTPGAAPERVTA